MLTLASSGSNVLTLTVNCSTCSAATSASYPNKPCVTVTMCDSTGANCQTIDDILLDTGDFGLRIFQQALSSTLLTALNQNPVQVNGSTIYECIEYGDGSTVWGPVEFATLNTSPTVQLPIQVIGSTAGNPSSVCSGTLSSPSDAFYNGSLGLGIFAQDCGSTCANSATSQYFTCSGKSCTETAVPLASQVQNPVAKSPTDNNGVLVSLPNSVPSTGAVSVTGSLIFGIGTRSNNTPSGVTVYGADSSGHLTTKLNSTVYSGFLDTGSNGIFFADSAITQSNIYSGFYAPSSTLPLTAMNTDSSNVPISVIFQIENANNLFATSNYVFNDLGGSTGGGLFDWGLPLFLLNQNVYVGIEGTSSSLGTGPYWAY